MQGRITKVLNMKPVEILAMIEEAAGTRMYEDRRDKALKNMAKKELKVEELKGLLKDEIEPKLEKLRQEKRSFLDFQQTHSDLERLTKIVVAHDYLRGKENLRKAAEQLEQKKQREVDLGESATRLKHEISLLQEDIKKIKAEREKELRKGGKFQALEEEVRKHSHEIVRLNTSLDLKKAAMTEEGERKTKLEASIKELESQLKVKQKHHEALQSKYDAAHADVAKQSEEYEKKEELLQSLQTGIASKEGQESGYQGQLQDAKNRVSTSSTEQEQAKLKINHLEKRIKEEEPKAKKAKDQNAGLAKELEGLRTQSKKLEAEMSKLGFQPNQVDDMHKEESTLQSRIRELREQADTLKRKVANIDFSYQDPTPKFNRDSVKGLVAQLFTLNKQHLKAGTALEICAGGRLYNVVVDTSATGTQLLQNGKLKKRVTIIPLDKIAAFKASSEKVGAAQKLAPGKVDLALSLIGFEDEVNAAMEYVFGSTLICDDSSTAKSVTFDPSVRMKSVTLEGDVYDPAGTLSGGSAPQSSGVLVTLQKLNEVTTELQAQERAIGLLQSTMAREKKKLDGAKKLMQDLDIKHHEIKLAEEQIASNSATSVCASLAALITT